MAKNYTFAWDRVTGSVTQYQAPKKNLREDWCDRRFIMGDSFFENYCASIGTCIDLTRKSAIKSKEKFIYQIGTQGGPHVWFCGHPKDGKPNMFDLLAVHRPKILQRMREKLCLLHIDQGWEGDPLIHNDTMNYYDIMYEKLAEYNIPPSQVLFTTSNLLEQKIHEKLYGHLQDKIKISSSSPFAEHVKESHSEIKYQKQINYKTNHSNIKTFSCLNRVPRTHRHALGLMLDHYNLLDDTICDMSMNNRFLGDRGKFLTEEDLIPKHWPEHKAFTIKNATRLLKKLPLRLDQDTLYTNPVFRFFEETYLNTWFSLTTETFYQEYVDNSFYFSEKAFKPMKMHHPFIIVGQPYSLRWLHQLGFKTFSKWWDESYSDIVNPTRRMEAICILVQQLSNKSHAEWLEIYEDMQDVLEHNYNHLMNTSFVNYKGLI